MCSNHLRLPKFTLCTSQGRPSRVTEWIWSTGASYVCIGRVQCCTTKTPQVALCVKAPTRMANWQLPNLLSTSLTYKLDFRFSFESPVSGLARGTMSAGARAWQPKDANSHLFPSASRKMALETIASSPMEQLCPRSGTRFSISVMAHAVAVTKSLTMRPVSALLAYSCGSKNR